ncbi:MAG: PAC2 family protein [Chloroflexi bacterium]|nr:PAC2 family protein [Chloroflexota bacterium]
MELGNFTIQEPESPLRAPHALAILRPWTDVGSAGTLALNELKRVLDGQPLGQLTRPGTFFDFTRYRPTVYYKDGRREVDLPNSHVSYARRPASNDFLFLHLLEPHARGEDYVEGILELLQHFGVKRYALVGSMYDMVPHTRPLLVSGSASDEATQATMARYGIRASTYEGPTTIMTLLTRLAGPQGMETVNLIARLPQYAPLDEDYNGTLRLLELLSKVYDLPLDLYDLRSKAEEQLRQVGAAVEANPQLRRALAQIEERYDKQRTEQAASEEETPLPPSIEKFLRELET